MSDRQDNARRVMQLFRPAQVEMDNAQHFRRELDFSAWFLRNPFTAQAVADWIADVGMRADSYPGVGR